MIVVDASLAAAWCLREPEGIAIADRMIERMRTETAVVPGIFWHEMRNVLVIAERRKRIEAEAAEVHLGRLRNLRFVTDDHQDDREILVLARRHGLTAYDAAYVETAKRRRARFVGLDRKLASAASREGVA